MIQLPFQLVDFIFGYSGMRKSSRESSLVSDIGGTVDRIGIFVRIVNVISPVVVVGIVVCFLAEIDDSSAKSIDIIIVLITMAVKKNLKKHKTRVI